MIEYLYDAIRASSGQNINIYADITDDNGNPIAEGCRLNLFSPDKEFIASFEGVIDENLGEWKFSIPAEATTGLKGRYFYCISYFNTSLCFKQPIYLV